MSQDPEDLIGGLDVFSGEQKYVRKHLNDWPHDIGYWLKEETVLIVPQCTEYDENIHYTTAVATNLPDLHKIPDFQAKTDALPNFVVVKTPELTDMELRRQEDQWVMSNSQSVCASQQDFIQCIRNNKPNVSFYSDISDAAFEQLSARKNTKLYYQSQRPSTSTSLNPGTDLSKNDQTQAAQSEADEKSQLSSP